MKRIIVFILLAILLAACSETASPLPTLQADLPTEVIDDGFDRQALLENITNKLILPAHENLAQKLADLQSAVDLFTDNPNMETLQNTQDAWLAANMARMAVLPYRIGLVDDSLLHNRLDNRPPRIKFIDEDILEGTDPIDSAYLSSIGSTSVGLGVMEYLLFDPENGNDAILQSFIDANNADRRGQLLSALAENLQQSGSELASIWQPEGQNYAQDFIEANMDSGELQGSMNMLANQMIAEVERIIASRLGKPAGMRSEGLVRPDLAEAPYSHASLARIIATVEELQRAFNGGDGLGFDDYLNYLDAQYESQPLSEAINDQFEASLAALQAIDSPLEIAVENNLEQVNAAIDELNKLLVLLKVDMANQLGLTLTINDNDGD